MFGEDHYVPILKGKKGEFDALGQLTAEVAARLTPLIEVPDLPWDYVEDRPSKSLDDHLDAATHAIVNCWAPHGRGFVELLCADGAAQTEKGHHAVEHLIGALRSEGVDAVPVVGPDHDAKYWNAVAAVVDEDSVGVCIRISGEDLADQFADESSTSDQLAVLDLDPTQVDLVIDLGGLSGSPAQQSLVASAQSRALPFVDDWRSLTVAFSSFPDPVSTEVPKNTESLVPRDDAGAWVHLTTKSLPRTPTFGDYGADSPGYLDVDPRLISTSMTAVIRYTTKGAWLIVRGDRLAGAGAPGYPQYHDLAKTLVSRSEYRGSDFSSADAFIEDCASGSAGPGNQTTWRTVATNHHLTHVVDAIASSGAP